MRKQPKPPDWSMSRWIWAIAMSGVPITAPPDEFISATRPSYVVAVRGGVGTTWAR